MELPDGQIEALDEAELPPGSPAPHHASREIILGVLLVVGVIGWAVVQAWTQQTQVTAYHRGTRAVAAQDWDTAAAAFGEAQGYADAAAQAATARQQVAARDTQYERAAAAARTENWADLLPAVVVLQAIAPQYRDTPQLAARVAAHVYTPALSGTVALRTAIAPPGLYTYAAGGWHWLAGSDAQSSVRGSCPDGGYIYDGPVAGATPSAAPPAALPPSDTPLLGRHLLVETPGGNLRGNLAFTPWTYAAYRCTAQGVWSAIDGGGSKLAQYQAFTATQAITPALPGPGWAIVAPSPIGGSRLLDDQAVVWLGYPSKDVHSRLYLDDGRGGRRLLDDRLGIFLQAGFTPDGRWVLETLRPPAPAPTGALTFVLLDAGGQTPAFVLPVPAAAWEGAGRGIGAQILARGARAGQVLVTWPAPGGQVIRLLDPAHPAQPVVDLAGEAGLDQLAPLGYDAANDGLLVYGQVGSGATAPAAASGFLIAYLDGKNRLHSYHPPLAPGAELVAAWVRDGWLVYGGVDQPTAAGQAVTLWRVPLAQLDAAPPPQVVYQTNLTAAVVPGTLPLYLGPGRLAYVTLDGGLHTRRYDGTEDLAIATGVRGFLTYDLFAGP